MMRRVRRRCRASGRVHRARHLTAVDDEHDARPAVDLHPRAAAGLLRLWTCRAEEGHLRVAAHRLVAVEPLPAPDTSTAPVGSGSRASRSRSQGGGSRASRAERDAAHGVAVAPRARRLPARLARPAPADPPHERDLHRRLLGRHRHGKRPRSARRRSWPEVRRERARESEDDGHGQQADARAGAFAAGRETPTRRSRSDGHSHPSRAMSGTGLAYVEATASRRRASCDRATASTSAPP